jgi:hypothetical protein
MDGIHLNAVWTWSSECRIENLEERAYGNSFKKIMHQRWRDKDSETAISIPYF